MHAKSDGEGGGCNSKLVHVWRISIQCASFFILFIFNKFNLFLFLYIISYFYFSNFLNPTILTYYIQLFKFSFQNQIKLNSWKTEVINLPIMTYPHTHTTAI